MVEPTPIIPTLKEGKYSQEQSISGDLNMFFRNFQGKKLKVSRNSPPLAKEIEELELIIDKTALRIYTKVNNTLRYWGLT
jgi:hypothetical protein